MNLAPLQLAPVYATPENGGVGEVQNQTETSYRMKEQVNLANAVYKYQTPYEQLVANRYPGAHFAIFDMYSLVRFNPATAQSISFGYLKSISTRLPTSQLADCDHSSPTCTRTRPSTSMAPRR